MRFLTAGAAPKRAITRAPHRWLLRLGISGGALAILAGGGFAVHASGADQRVLAMVSGRILALSAASGLAVTEIAVEGRHRASPERILAALGAGRGTPILAVNPTQAKARLEAMPWVRSASVERLLPGTLYIRIVERQPLALWQRHGKLELVDADGKVLPTPRLDEFSALPVLVGEDAPKQGAPLVEMLDTEPELARRVVAAVRIGGRRWDLHLDNGIDVEMPEENPSAAWHELARLDRSEALLKRDIQRIDLRLPDRLVVQTTPAPAKPASKKKPSPGKSA